MSPVSHRRRFSRYSLAAMIAVLGLSALALTQCRITESTTGVNLEGNGLYGGGRSSCEKECNEDFKRCKKEADDRFKDIKDACNQLSGEEKKECKKAASERHKDAKQECSERKRACKAACRYREGGGSAGR